MRRVETFSPCVFSAAVLTPSCRLASVNWTWIICTCPTLTLWQRCAPPTHTHEKALSVPRASDLLLFFHQSCHIGEEDEGGDQEGEEPSFEVRQTEMVWGDQGRGHRGVGEDAAPRPPSDHTVTSHPAHPPHPTLSTAYLSFPVSPAAVD